MPIQPIRAALVAGCLLAATPLPAFAAPDAANGALKAAVLGKSAPVLDPTALPRRAEDFQRHGAVALSLAQAQELGLQHNRDLLVARQSLSSAKFNDRKAQALLFPTLSANAGATNALSSGEALAASATGRSPASAWSVDPNVALTYDLGTDGSRGAQLDLAKAQVGVAELEVTRQELGLRQQIATAYYDLQSADQQVRISRQDLDNATKSLNDTRALQKAGIQTVFEIERAEVHEARSRAALVNAQAQQRVATQTLARVLGLAFDADVTASDPITTAPAWTLGLPETILKAVGVRPEVGQARLQEQAGDAQIRLAQSATMPHVAISGGADTLAVPGTAVGYNGGISLSMPLFEGGATHAAVEAARADRHASAIKLADTVSQIQLQVEQAYAQMESSKANVETTAVALRTAKASLQSARIRFTAGVGTQTELIDAENDLTQAEGEAINAVLGYNRAIASLNALVGR